MKFEEVGEDVRQIAVSQIRLPRTSKLHKSFAVESVVKNGIVIPIIVRGSVGRGFTVVDGEQRVLAARKCSLAMIPAYVVKKCSRSI